MAVKVLILEDNPVARSFLCRVVRESFSDTILITEAGDLETARRHVARAPTASARVDPFKLILVDLELPDGNGMELLAELARYPATKIVTTLYSDDDHLFPALQCGADGYLLKEDRFEVLVEELQKIVRGQPPLSPAIARRLLTHFRQGSAGPRHTPGREAAASTPLVAPLTGLQSSRPMPLGRGAPMDHERLTPRESEVLTYLSKGFTIKEIANLMGIKWFTVNDHIKSIYKKLNVSSRAEAAVLASKAGAGVGPAVRDRVLSDNCASRRDFWRSVRSLILAALLAIAGVFFLGRWLGAPNGRLPNSPGWRGPSSSLRSCCSRRSCRRRTVSRRATACSRLSTCSSSSTASHARSRSSRRRCRSCCCSCFERSSSRCRPSCWTMRHPRADRRRRVDAAGAGTDAMGSSDSHATAPSGFASHGVASACSPRRTLF